MGKLIEKNGFKPSSEGSIGPGYYFTDDKEWAMRIAIYSALKAKKVALKEKAASEELAGCKPALITATVDLGNRVKDFGAKRGPSCLGWLKNQKSEKWRGDASYNSGKRLHPPYYGEKDLRREFAVADKSQIKRVKYVKLSRTGNRKISNLYESVKQWKRDRDDRRKNKKHN